MLQYRWGNAVEGFNLPLKVYINGNETRLEPATSWKQFELPDADNFTVTIDPNYYVSSFNLLGKE